MNGFFKWALVMSVVGGWGTSVCEAQDKWTTLTSTDGRKIEAQILKVEEETVTFRTKTTGEREFTLGFDRFAKEDQDVLKEWEATASESVNPVIANSRVTVVSESERESIYRTANFEFRIDQAVGAEAVAEFAPRFEMTLHGFKSVPLSLTPKAVESHFRVRMISSSDDFKIASGQSIGDQQIGFYNLADDTFYAMLERANVGLPLRYELSFALLNKRLEKMPPWLAVAVADFVASAPEVDQRLDFSDPGAAIRKYLADNLGEAAVDVTVVKPEQLMQLDYGAFRTGSEESILKNRASALLLFYFTGFLDGSGNGRGLKAYNLDLRANVAMEDALKHILGEREWSTFQNEMKVKFLVKGFRLEFQ